MILLLLGSKAHIISFSSYFVAVGSLTSTLMMTEQQGRFPGP